MSVFVIKLQASLHGVGTCSAVITKKSPTETVSVRDDKSRCHPVSWHSHALSGIQSYPRQLTYAFTSHILGMFLSFLFALRSPFGSSIPAAISPSAALSWAEDTAYLLSFNGLAQCSTRAEKVQAFSYTLKKNIRFRYWKAGIRRGCLPERQGIKVSGSDLTKTFYRCIKGFVKAKASLGIFSKALSLFTVLLHSQTVESLSLHRHTTGEGKGVFDDKSSGRPCLYIA